MTSMSDDSNRLTSAEIRHDVPLSVSAAEAYSALTTVEGISKWLDS